MLLSCLSSAVSCTSMYNNKSSTQHMCALLLFALASMLALTHAKTQNKRTLDSMISLQGGEANSAWSVACSRLSAIDASRSITQSVHQLFSMCTYPHLLGCLGLPWPFARNERPSGYTSDYILNDAQSSKAMDNELWFGLT